MIQFSDDDLATFSRQGWVKLSIGLGPEKLVHFCNLVEEMVAQAKRKGYPYGRIYQDILGCFNLTAVEAPFHVDVCPQSVLDLLSSLHLGETIKQLNGWLDPCATLARLFCSGSIKHEGAWHRDGNERDAYLIVGIFLKDETGFRIVKKATEEELVRKVFGTADMSKTMFSLPADMPKDNYDELDIKAGEILFFDPAILHQGHYTGTRLNFHLGFRKNPAIGSELVRVKGFDFPILKALHPEASESDRTKLPKLKRRLKNRLITTFNYFLPVMNFLSFSKIVLKRSNDQPQKVSILANTFYQRK